MDIDYGFAAREGDVELYTILAKVIGLVPASAVSTDLTRYYSEEADVSLSDFVRANPGIAVGVVAVVVAMLLASVATMRALRAERKIKERELQVKDLSGRVYVDPLTSVRNKAGFDRYMAELEEQVASPGGVAPFAVAVMDCDDLKRINDQHGHDRGDDYLKAACRLICRVFSHSTVFRVGGDEFVVVLQNDDYQNADSLVEELGREQEATCASAANPWDEVHMSINGTVRWAPHREGTCDGGQRAHGRLEGQCACVRQHGRAHGACQDRGNRACRRAAGERSGRLGLQRPLPGRHVHGDSVGALTIRGQGAHVRQHGRAYGARRAIEFKSTGSESLQSERSGFASPAQVAIAAR